MPRVKAAVDTLSLMPPIVFAGECDLLRQRMAAASRGEAFSAVPVKRRAVDARYDWSRNQATWSGDVKPDRSGPVPLQAGDMDGLLINLAIARDVAAGKPLNYRMVDGGRVKTLSYRVIGKENMTVGGKTVETTKVSRVDGNKEQIAWVAPNMPVPVRLLQREDGQNSLDLTIKSLR